jgi:hypothetical protein
MKLSTAISSRKELFVWPMSGLSSPFYDAGENLLIGRFRSVFHDEKYFSNPNEFIPERFLSKGNETGATALLDPLAWLFGFGRRYVLP